MQSHTHNHGDESPSESATPAKVQEQAAVPAQSTPTEPTPVPVSGAHQHSEAQFRNIADRGWLDELLSFVSASLTVAEDSEVPGHVRFTVAPACTNERATEQVMILLDKCAEIAPMSFVDLRAKRRPNRLQRADLTSAKAYAEYSRVLRMKLNQMHDLAVMAQALLDLACVAADPLLRFNTRQVLADVDVLARILDATAETGLTTYDVSSSAGVIPDGAERDVVKGVPVLLHMSGAEAFAFRHIADALTELAEFADATVTRLSERLWWVEPE